MNDEWVSNKIKEEIKRYLETDENENTTQKSMAHSKSSHKREFPSIAGLSQETRKSSSKQSNFILKGISKWTTKPKVSTKKE